MSKQSKPASAYSTYWRLLSYIKPYLWAMALTVLALMVLAAADAIMYKYVAQQLVDKGVVERDSQFLARAPFYIIGVFAARGIAAFVSTYFLDYAGRAATRDLRNQMMRKLIKVPATFYDHHLSGNIISKFTFDVEQVNTAVTNAVSESLLGIFMLIGMFWVLFSTSWQITLVLLLVGPLLGYYIKYISVRMRKYSTRIQDSMGDVNHAAAEIIDNYQSIRVYGGQAFEANRFQNAVEITRKQGMRMTFAIAASVPIMQLTGACAMSGLIYLATMDQWRLTPGEFTTMFGAMLALLRPIKQVAAVNSIFQRGIAAASSIFALIDEPEEKNTGALQLTKAAGDIRFENVFYKYKNSEQWVLNDVSFEIQAGQSIALVGRSGGGKSTIVKLLPRFYDVTQGHIYLDGQKLEDYGLEHLRTQVAVVSQQVTLFEGTVFHNIAYGQMANATEAEVISALKAAQAWDFVQQLPKGLASVIGENGVLLSGGQRQRLAIARAILKDAPILILDEATSALDSESEQMIQVALDHVMKNRTTIMIAHRLSTIEKADKIFVVENGCIVEQGNHSELLARNNRYALLQQMQLKTRTDDASPDTQAVSHD